MVCSYVKSLQKKNKKALDPMDYQERVREEWERSIEL